MKTYTCPDCGGENVSQDAVARWNMTGQIFETSGFLDSFACDDCEREIKRIEEREITEKTRYKAQWRPLPDTGWPWTDAGEFPTREDAMQAASAGAADHHDRNYRVIPVWEE